MKKSYLSNYLKLYFWQFFAIVLNFAAMLIVLPIISTNSELFGIYSLCISITIFLSYADIGFVSAGMKYASEYFARKELKEEVGVTGFVLFVLSIGIIPYICCMLWFWHDPNVIISNLSIDLVPTASSMFLILALFAPNLLFQKASQFIYGVRVEDYIARQVNIVGHILKIISIFYFFRSGESNIVGYFLFFQFINFLCFFIAVVYAGYLYRFPLLKLLQSINFSSQHFQLTKKLAFTSFFSTIAWILYYEIDNLVIGKYFGVHSIAIYAVGLNILSFLRSIFGVIFSPLTARFNHFVGVGDHNGLKLFYSRIILVLFPLLCFPIITIILLMQNLVLCWVGDAYKASIPIGQLLVATFLFAFLTYPAGILIMAYEKTKMIMGISAILVIIFWFGILIFGNQLGMLAFSLFKFISYMISVFIFTLFSIKILNKSIWVLSKKYLFAVSISVVTMVVFIIHFQKLLPLEKSTQNLLFVITTGIVASFLSTALYFCLSKEFRREILFLFRRLHQRFQFL